MKRIGLSEVVNELVHDKLTRHYIWHHIRVVLPHQMTLDDSRHFVMQFLVSPKDLETGIIIFYRKHKHRHRGQKIGMVNRYTVAIRHAHKAMRLVLYETLTDDLIGNYFHCYSLLMPATGTAAGGLVNRLLKGKGCGGFCPVHERQAPRRQAR